jgi:hypothetical protein
MMRHQRERHADVIIVGGGAGGCAAALAALRLGKSAVMTEETPWIGGQFTSQGVPPDEHRFIEYFGASDSYREFRSLVREYYRRNFPLTPDARRRRFLNPGTGECSSLSCEPRAALAAFQELLTPYVHSARLTILQPYEAEAAEAAGDRVLCVRVRSRTTGDAVDLVAPYFIDATDLGDLLPLAGIEHVTGAEPRDETGEPHAVEGPAEPRLMQGITWCYAVDYMEGEDHTIEKPGRYDFFRTHVPPHWPGPQLSFVALDYDTLGPWQHTFLPAREDGPLWESLWTHRRLLDRRHFVGDLYASDVTLVNWTQNDYFLGPIVGVEPEEAKQHLEMSRALSLSLLYWLQTEAPRQDGGTGFPGLRLRHDVMGTEDGLAMNPYIRESRRIRAEFTMLEQHISAESREDGAELFDDAVGIGYYFLDMHQPTEGAIPFLTQTWPFQIPLGSLIPVRVKNLLPGCKNLGVTHIVNSATRVHPVEWAVGEATGSLAAFCVERGLEPAEVRSDGPALRDFQALLQREGVEIAWPDLRPVAKWDEHLAYTVS